MARQGGECRPEGVSFQVSYPGANSSLILLGNLAIQQRHEPQNCTSFVVSELGYLYPSPASIGWGPLPLGVGEVLTSWYFGLSMWADREAFIQEKPSGRKMQVLAAGSRALLWKGQASESFGSQ